MVTNKFVNFINWLLQDLLVATERLGGTSQGTSQVITTFNTGLEINAFQ